MTEKESQRQFATEALPLPDGDLERQLDSFLSTREQILGKRLELGDFSEDDLSKRQEYLKKFSNVFLMERITRSEDIESSKVKSAVQIFEKWLPFHTYGVVCYDGRLGAAVMFGIPGGYGGFLRTKGGDLSHFDIGKNGELVLEKNSNIDILLREAEDNKPGLKCQVLDSHIGCAARGNIEQRRGKAEKYDDGGLYKDVQRKKRIADAFLQREILPIQFSSDPRRGFGFMGLEKEEALEYAKGNKGFSHDVLNHLVREKVILSTEDIADEFIEEFRPHEFNIDWEDDYANSSYEFAHRLDVILDSDVYNSVYSKVAEVFKGKVGVTPEELQERTVLLIANALNGYLQNKANDNEYPHDSHKEQCIVILEQGFGPYKVTKELPVVPGDNLLGDTDFAQQHIIRANRIERQSIEDFTGIYETPEEFLEAPVPIYLLGIVKGNNASGIDEEDWTVAKNINWNELPEDWYLMDNEKFSLWIEKQDLHHQGLIRTLSTLRNRYLQMMRRGDISRFVADGSIEIIPILANQDRRPISIPNLKFDGVELAAS